MSGGKGGSTTEETALPAWLREPAIRNLQRAEDVQRIPYMPYYGADVAAFTPAQNAAFDTNIGAAEAFGLIAPGSMTPTSGMPEPTEFAGGFKGYSSQPLYEQALAELKNQQPDAVAQYDALFGGNVPTQNNPGGGGAGGGAGGGGAGGGAGAGAGAGAGGNVMGHTAYATAEDAMAAGDYWSAYRKDHQQWRDNQGIYAGGKGKQPGQSDTDYPGNPDLGIRSDQNQLEAMGMGGDNTTTTPVNDPQMGSGLEGLNPDPYGSGLDSLNTYNQGTTAPYVNPNEETLASGTTTQGSYNPSGLEGLTTYNPDVKKKMI